MKTLTFILLAAVMLTSCSVSKWGIRRDFAIHYIYAIDTIYTEDPVTYEMFLYLNTITIKVKEGYDRKGEYNSSYKIVDKSDFRIVKQGSVMITTAYDIVQAYNKCADTMINLTKIYSDKYYGRITITKDSVENKGLIKIEKGDSEIAYEGPFVELDNKDYNTKGNVYQFLITDDKGVTLATMLKEYVDGSFEKYGNEKYIFQVIIARDTNQCYLDFTTVKLK